MTPLSVSELFAALRDGKAAMDLTTEITYVLYGHTIYRSSIFHPDYSPVASIPLSSSAILTGDSGYCLVNPSPSLTPSEKDYLIQATSPIRPHLVAVEKLRLSTNRTQLLLITDGDPSTDSHPHELLLLSPNLFRSMSEGVAYSPDQLGI